MKFLSKITGAVVALAIVLSLGLANPFGTVSAASSTYQPPAVGEWLTISKDYISEYEYEDVIDAEHKIRLPDVDFSGGILFTEVRDSAFRVIGSDDEYGSSVNENSGILWDNTGFFNYFELPAGRIGTFTVNYSVTAANQVKTSQSITIKINGITPRFNFNTNSEHILPIKTIPGKLITLPWPEILDPEGEPVPGNPKPIINVKKPSHDNQDLELDTDGFLTFTPAPDVFGKYVVTYSYAAVGTESIRFFHDISVVSDQLYKPAPGANSDIKLAMTLASAMPGTASLGVETTLPLATGRNTLANDERINVHTKVEVQNHTANTTAVDITDKFTETGFKYTFPTAGNYLVTYVITDFFKNTAEQSFFIRDVRDNISPTVKVVDFSAFTQTVIAVDDGKGGTVDKLTELNGKPIDEWELDDFEDASWLIPSRIGLVEDAGDPQVLGPTITLPGIFAKDNVDPHSELKLIRELVRKTGGTVHQLDSGKNSWDEVTHPFKPGDEGEWIIRYKAYDTVANNLPSTREFSIIVDSDKYEDRLAPVIEFTGVPSQKRHGDKFTVRKPSVADYLTTDRLEIADARVFVVTEFFFNDDEDSAEKAQELESDKSLFEFKIPSKFIHSENGEEPVTKMTIRVTAIDDAGNKATLPRHVTVIDTTSDTGAPIVVTKAGVERPLETGETHSLTDYILGADELIPSNLDQNKNIKLPELSFLDTVPAAMGIELDPNINVKVVVTDVFGAVVPVTAVNSSISHLVDTVVAGKGTVRTIQNLQFFAATAGLYTITYTANDTAGNIFCFAYNFGVANRTPPAINPENIKPTAEWGDLIDIKGIIVTTNGDLMDFDMVFGTPDGNIETGELDGTINGGDDWDDETVVVSVSNDKVVPRFDMTSLVAETGTYTIRYWAKDADNNITSNYVERLVVAADTIAPAISILDGGPDRSHPFTVNGTTENDITIPGFASMSDAGSGVDENSTKIVVKYRDSSSALATFTSNLASHKFRATRNGVLDITYSVADKAGNVASLSFEMVVGKITQPLIQINNMDRNAPNNVNKPIGTELSINRNDLKLIDDGVTQDHTRITITVTLDGATVTPDATSDTTTVKFTFNSAGKVRITYSATDDAGNKAEPREFTFTISDEPNNPVMPTVIWGTILLVVSLLALGGVIFYFVKPVRGSKGEGKPKSKKE
ncbi:MAG: hypothetical protein FWE53_02250 [Firmicutes bacterium]|nr:hypothetical protein [Bacillota bacterium]